MLGRRRAGLKGCNIWLRQNRPQHLQKPFYECASPSANRTVL